MLKMFMLKILLLILLTLGLTGCNTKKESIVNETLENLVAKENIEKNMEEIVQYVRVDGFAYPSGPYFPLDKAIASVVMSNWTKEGKEVWTEIKVKDRLDQVIYSYVEKSSLVKEEVKTQNMTWPILSDIKSGSYKMELTVWDKAPEDTEAVILAQSKAENRILCYTKQEDFDVLDLGIWETSDKKLGRSRFKTKNISVKEGLLKIAMPANKLEGGEIFMKQPQGYGTYEIRMRLPSAPSSITGFFFYEPPDFFSEIDIELYNESGGTLLLTTYAEGAICNELVGELGFDPTTEFHDYRMEYYEDSVAFYIDNQYIKGWTTGFSKDPMKLMLNTWYPSWLAGEPPKEEQSLLVDWIRY